MEKTAQKSLSLTRSLVCVVAMATPPFLPAAKPSDLGTLGVVVFVVFVVFCFFVGGGGPLLELTHVQFFRGVFKSCQIFLSSQNPSNTLERCVQELPDFLNPPPK